MGLLCKEASVIKPDCRVFIVAYMCFSYIEQQGCIGNCASM